MSILPYSGNTSALRAIFITADQLSRCSFDKRVTRTSTCPISPALALEHVCVETFGSEDAQSRSITKTRRKPVELPYSLRLIFHLGSNFKNDEQPWSSILISELLSPIPCAKPGSKSRLICDKEARFGHNARNDAQPPPYRTWLQTNRQVNRLKKY